MSVYSPHGLQSVDQYILWGLLGLCLSRQQPDPTLLATPYDWIMKRLGMAIGEFQYEQLRGSLNCSRMGSSIKFTQPVIIPQISHYQGVSTG